MFTKPGTAAAVLVLAVSVSTAPVAEAAPAFKLPFICGATYTGLTRSGHGWAVDFNQSNNADAGDPIIASAGGYVSETRYAYSNGQITITHSGGWKTKYAHMSRIAVKLNQTVARGKLLGFVDDVGNATTDHLHFEQIYNGSRVQVRFDGVKYRYGRAITSTNCDDKTPPYRTAPNPGFLRGSTLKTSGAAVPVLNTWSVADALSGVNRSALEIRTNDGAWALVARSTHPSSPSYMSYLTPSDTWRRTHRVRVIDYAGNLSTYATGPTYRIRRLEESAPEVALAGAGWATPSDLANYSAGTVLRASTAGNSATLAQQGHDFAIVATKGPNRGRFQVYVDGAASSVVDLYAATTAYRQVVWHLGFGGSGPHTVELRVLGQKNPASTATIVDLDAFLVLQP